MATGKIEKTYTAEEVNKLLYYQPGDIASFTNTPAFGDVTGGTKTLEFSVFLPKIVPLSATVTLTQLLISFRTPSGGYIESLNYNALANSVIGTRNTGAAAFRFTCDRDTAWYSTNNVPVVGTATLTMRIN